MSDTSQDYSPAGLPCLVGEVQPQWEGWISLKPVLAPGILKELNGPFPQGSGANKNRSPGSFLGSSLSFCYRSVLFRCAPCYDLPLAACLAWASGYSRALDILLLLGSPLSFATAKRSMHSAGLKK